MLAAGAGWVNRDPIGIQRCSSLSLGLDLFRCGKSLELTAETNRRATGRAE